MTDYRRLRPNNLTSPEFRHLLLLLHWPVFGAIFYAAERLVPRTFHPVWCPLDDLIPFCELFMVPYLFWFVFLIGMHVYLGLTDIPAFRQFMQFIIFGYGITLAVYLIYPTCQELRPSQFPRDNLLTRMVADFYEFDTNTNVCPSLHCVGSMAVVFASWHTEGLRGGLWRPVITLTGLLISFSTVFVKQHSIIDVFCALALCAAGYALVYVYVPQRQARIAGSHGSAGIESHPAIEEG